MFKRVFHLGPTEAVTGADFVLEKLSPNASMLGATAVQVKRNRRQPWFEFTSRDFVQLDRFEETFGSPYYLTVDETLNPPGECFLHAREVKELTGSPNPIRSVRITNADVRRFCRGIDIFYREFYSSRRGAWTSQVEYDNLVSSYVKLMKRVVIDLIAKRLR